MSPEMPPGYRPGVATHDLDEDGSAPGLPRLPPGRHGLSREFVTRNQLDRLTAGMIAAIAEHGYHGATISQIAEAAGVSRRTFYGYYSGKEECFFATYQVIFDHLRETMTGAAGSAEDWPGQVRARLRAMLGVFAANPDLVSFTMIAPQAAGGEIAARYRTLLAQLVGVLKGEVPAEARQPSPAAEHGLIGAASALLVREVRAGRGENLPDLLPDLVELVLAPYLGRERAIAAARG
jgi:AcrR family transcriptional regulator